MLPIAITLGEPAGIGAEIVAQIASESLSIPWVFVGDPLLLQRYCPKLQCVAYKQSEQTPQIPGIVSCLAIPLNAPVVPGKLDKENVPYVLNCLTEATYRVLQGEFAALVTGPVHKAIINQTGVTFRGQTEWIAQLCGIHEKPVMMLCYESFRVALVTTHLPLSDVAKAINAERLEQVIRTVIVDLQQRFAIETPRVAVCGLNPHAGEGGYLGREEIDIISPVISQFQQQGAHIVGPIPADSAFTADMREKFDVWITMYHDQGLPVLKALGFHRAVNVTLGLPIVRTSVDHGTALDRVGKNSADSASFLAAIQLAQVLSSRVVVVNQLP